MPRRARDTAQSNTYRFFVAPDTLQGATALLDDADLVRQIGVVLRLGPGDRIVLLDNSGAEHLAVIERIERGRIAARIEARTPATGEPRVELTLYPALIRPERFEWILQKGTELGATAFAPVVCARSLVEGGSAAKRQARWERVIREAAEQSRRGRLPALLPPQPFDAACAAQRHDLALLLWEVEGALGLRTALAAQAGTLGGVHPSIGIFSGPEGGLTPDEHRTALRHGIMPVSLGSRILRAETAPIAAAAAVLLASGDLGA
jgi:16S rRNA (uracil1498-N3)-methyltransferase